MEILIVGIVVVGIMAWASTRIKRTAAAAFDKERIETDEFVLNKPDEWLSIVSPKPPYLFEAYSRAFGKEPNEKIRLGTATVEKISGNLDDAASRAVQDRNIRGDIREVVAGVHYRVIELTQEEATRLEWIKFAQAKDSVYTLRVEALGETTDEFRRDIESMVDSFQLKTL